ncbi:MAG: peptide ABC transporter ATP-binding protein, partial [Candidatus Omnitrophica bacterium]|nr:peptide ABC transporter ATP-binding protein [Candidatus Omnitrophota bacterium]
LKIVVDFCERIVVMYQGNIVEEGSVEQILKSPLHPYTKILWNPSSITSIREEKYKDFDGCVFLARCPYRKKICFEHHPVLKEKEKKHLVSCFLYEQEKMV